MVADTRLLDKVQTLEDTLNRQGSAAFPVILRGFDKSNVLISFVEDDRVVSISPKDFHDLGLRLTGINWLD